MRPATWVAAVGSPHISTQSRADVAELRDSRQRHVKRNLIATAAATAEFRCRQADMPVPPDNGTMGVLSQGITHKHG